jgi:hypothetical protein
MEQKSPLGRTLTDDETRRYIYETVAGLAGLADSANLTDLSAVLRQIVGPSGRTNPRSEDRSFGAPG